MCVCVCVCACARACVCLLCYCVEQFVKQPHFRILAVFPTCHHLQPPNQPMGNTPDLCYSRKRIQHMSTWWTILHSRCNASPMSSHTVPRVVTKGKKTVMSLKQDFILTVTAFTKVVPHSRSTHVVLANR